MRKCTVNKCYISNVFTKALIAFFALQRLVLFESSFGDMFQNFEPSFM